nr:MAG TPA: hypothetical protein [Caudoviricetes sp.]
MVFFWYTRYRHLRIDHLIRPLHDATCGGLILPSR